MPGAEIMDGSLAFPGVLVFAIGFGLVMLVGWLLGRHDG